MEIFGAFFAACMRVLTRQLDMFGYSFSFWNLAVFTMVVGLLSRFVWGAMDDE